MILVFMLSLIGAAAVTVQAQDSDKELRQVLIANEGNFGQGNASLSRFSVSDSNAAQNVYSDANGGNALGDVAQSISKIDGSYYVVVNNSHRIVVLDEETLQQQAVIPIPNEAGPREIRKVAEDTAYVTNLNGNDVSLIDLQTYEEVDSIAVGMNPDKITLHNEKAYVSNWGYGNDSTISVIDINTHEVTDTLVASAGPRSLRVDDQDRLWVISEGYAGDYDDDFNLIPGTSKPGGLHVFDLSDHSELEHHQLPNGGIGEDLVIHNEAGKAYINTGGVRSVDMESLELAADTLIKGSFYHMSLSKGVKPTFYLTDAQGFTQAGTAVMYSVNGDSIGSFGTGVGPGSIHYSYETTTSNPVVEEPASKEFELGANYPNPFNPSTTIPFTLTRSSDVHLAIYNSIGREVKTLIDGKIQSGRHTARFRSQNLASGIYHYRLTVDGRVQTKTMMLIK